MMKSSSKLFGKAIEAKRESKYIEFKEIFDVENNNAWLEIIKDIVAIANSGGGAIVFGIKDNGNPSEHDILPVLNLDPAKITDKVAKYTGEQFSDFEIREGTREGKQVAVLLIRHSNIPIVFSKHGSYQLVGGKQKKAFGKGVVYFRHGAKSEPGNSNDLRKFLEVELERIRKTWLGNIRKVVDAPKGYRIKMLPPEVVQSSLPTATPIRIVTDPEAPGYYKIDPDKTHPYRQKEVLLLVNNNVEEEDKINGYNILCIRRVYDVDNNPSYFYKSKFSAPVYTKAFVDWLVDEYKKDRTFFKKTRDDYSSKRVKDSV